MAKIKGDGSRYIAGPKDPHMSATFKLAPEDWEDFKSELQLSSPLSPAVRDQIEEVTARFIELAVSFQ